MDLSSGSHLVTGKGITMSEALGMGGETVVIGLGIVFAVLAILMIVLYIFGVIFNKKPKADPTPQKAEEAPVMQAAEAVQEEDEDELIAVLTAAVAASLGTSTYNLRIKSYRRVPPKRPAWNRAGINDVIGNRF